MKITNFKNYVERKVPHEGYIGVQKEAEVDIETRQWLRKTVMTRKVFLAPHAVFWRFFDTGELIPGYKVESLYEAYKAARNAARY